MLNGGGVDPPLLWAGPFFYAFPSCIHTVLEYALSLLESRESPILIVHYTFLFPFCLIPFFLPPPDDERTGSDGRKLLNSILFWHLPRSRAPLMSENRTLISWSTWTCFFIFLFAIFSTFACQTYFFCLMWCLLNVLIYFFKLQIPPKICNKRRA